MITERNRLTAQVMSVAVASNYDVSEDEDEHGAGAEEDGDGGGSGDIYLGELAAGDEADYGDVAGHTGDQEDGGMLIFEPQESNVIDMGPIFLVLAAVAARCPQGTQVVRS